MTTTTERYAGSIALSKEALKAVMLVNGAAAIALLAFFGQLAGKEAKLVIPALAPVLLWFAGGVLLGALATGIGYITQLNYERGWHDQQSGGTDWERWHRRAQRAHACAIGLVVIGLVCFAIGNAVAVCVLLSSAW